MIMIILWAQILSNNITFLFSKLSCVATNCNL